MEKLTIRQFMHGVEERAAAAWSVIEAIPGAIEQVQYNDGLVVSDLTKDRAVLQAGPLSVFFQVVHGLPDTTFIQYGYILQDNIGDLANVPVGEMRVTPVDVLVNPLRQFVASRIFPAVEEVANHVVRRYGDTVRIRDGAVLEPEPIDRRRQVAAGS